MRIGIDGRLWNETGVGRYIRNLVEQLLRIDRTNDYILFVRPVDSNKIKDQIAKIKNEFEIENVKLKIVVTDVQWHSIAEQVRFPDILYKERLDLMHFTYFSLPIFYNRPFVVTIHDLIITHFPTGRASTLPYPFYRLKRLGYDFVMEHAVRNSKKIIVPLNAVREDVMQTFGVLEDKIAVTYEGSSTFNVQRSKLEVKIKNYFLYVGNAYPHKNLEKLIEAFSQFKQEMKEEVSLVLVGKDDYFYQRLRQKIKQEKLENILIKHNVNDEELFSLYSHARAFVSPSLMEGFGLPPLEAMSASCQVLLSDIPSFREVCQDAAWYFDPQIKQSLTQQMRFVYTSDHKIKEEKIRKGLERVKIFSWEKMAKETVQIYESSISI